MYLNDSRFVATGCIGSRTDYLYVAEPASPDQGVGITCVSPVVSPTGRYVFFRAPSARSAPPPPAPCCCVLDLAETGALAYRVHPLLGDTSDRVAFVLTEPAEKWYWPPDEPMFDCQDAAGQAHTPVSPTVWSPDGLKVAFIDRVIGGTVNIQLAHEFVVLDLTTGVQMPRTLTLRIDYQSIATSAVTVRPEAVEVVLLDWIDGATLKVVFRTPDLKALRTRCFRLVLPPTSDFEE